MDWMLMPYRRYFDFSGRSRRKEFWMFQLFQFIVVIVLYALLFAGFPAIDAATGQVAEAPGALFYLACILLAIFALASIIPAIAVEVRRLHDQDKSGWWILIALIPLGGLVLLVFMFLEGTNGPNRFGEDPKATPDDVFG